MKLSRIELKSLIKECLLELLSEGLGQQTGTRVVERRTVPAAQLPARARPRTASSSTNGRGSVSAPVKEAIRRQSGGDPVLAGILADTARTTLPAMLEGERGVTQGDAAQRAVAAVTPEQMFDPSTTDRWGKLAFMPVRPGASVGLPPEDGSDV